MDEQTRKMAKTKIFLGYLFALIFIVGTIVTVLIWMLAKDQRAVAGLGIRHVVLVGVAGIVASIIFYLYAVTARKNAKEAEETSRELRPSPFKAVSDKTYRVIAFIVNVIFMVDIIAAMFFLTFGQLLVLIPPSVLQEGNMIAEDIQAFYNVLYVLTRSTVYTAVVSPLVYIVVDLLLAYFRERNNLLVQQAQDIEDLKNK